MEKAEYEMYASIGWAMTGPITVKQLGSFAWNNFDISYRDSLIGCIIGLVAIHRVVWYVK